MNNSEYNAWIGGIARRFKQSQIKAATAVNVEMLKFYWSLGADIVRLEKNQPWGSKFMPRVSADLKAWMPDAKCFSRVNLYYMVRFFKLYSPRPIVHQLGEQLPGDGKVEGAQQVVAQMVQQVAEQLPLKEFEAAYPNVSRILFSVPWRHHIVLMDKFSKEPNVALFYACKTVENGWSRAMLENNIASNLHLRQGAAETNFDIALADPDSDLAKETLKGKKVLRETTVIISKPTNGAGGGGTPPLPPPHRDTDGRAAVHRTTLSTASQRLRRWICPPRRNGFEIATTF